MSLPEFKTAEFRLMLVRQRNHARDIRGGITRVHPEHATPKLHGELQELSLEILGLAEKSIDLAMLFLDQIDKMEEAHRGI